jgi:hypothetical protein
MSRRVRNDVPMSSFTRALYASVAPGPGGPRPGVGILALGRTHGSNRHDQAVGAQRSIDVSGGKAHGRSAAGRFARHRAWCRTPAHAEDNEGWNAPGPAMAGGHVLPGLTVSAPGVGSRSEAGIGALIPWADRLWAVGYVAHIRGEGLGLYEIRPDLHWRLHPDSVTGTFANRLVHWRSNRSSSGHTPSTRKGTSARSRH